jgi:hypothetical protein
MFMPDKLLKKHVSMIAPVLCAAILLWLVSSQAALGEMPADPAGTETRAAVREEPAASEESVRGFKTQSDVNVRLIVENAVSPTLQIARYTTGTETMTFMMGCLIATGAGLVFVAPIATVPAAVGPLANAGAGTAAAGVAAGEAWSIDSLLGGSRAKVLRDVVASVDMEAHLRSALERFLKARDMARKDAKGELEVIITGYGFQTSKEADDACNFIDVRTLLRKPGREQVEDRVFVGQGAEGDDIPPPHCTKLKRFLENDGSLARQTLIESAEIAAAVIVQRLNRRPP